MPDGRHVADVQHGHRPDRRAARLRRVGPCCDGSAQAGEPGACRIGTVVRRQRRRRAMPMMADAAAVDRRADFGARQQPPGASSTPSPPAGCDADIAVVISNRADAAGLDARRAAGSKRSCIGHSAYPSRDAFDARAGRRAARARRVAWCAWPGSCACSGRRFVEAFPNAILNIHPSLLPAFPGRGRAGAGLVEHGVKIDRRDGAPGDERARRRPDRHAGGRAGARRRHRRIAGRRASWPRSTGSSRYAVRTVLGKRWRLEGRRFLAL